MMKQIALCALLVLVGSAASASDTEETIAQVSRILSARHSVTCQQVFDLAEAAEIRSALISVAESDARPSWVPVRAARCVVEIAPREPAAMDAVTRWLAPEAPPGFVVVIASGLDGFEEADAVQLGQRLLTRTSADAHLAQWVKPYLAGSRHASVSALLPEK